MLNFAVATTAHAKRFIVSNMQDFIFIPLASQIGIFFI